MDASKGHADKGQKLPERGEFISTRGFHTLPPPPPCPPQSCAPVLLSPWAGRNSNCSSCVATLLRLPSPSFPFGAASLPCLPRPCRSLLAEPSATCAGPVLFWITIGSDFSRIGLQFPPQTNCADHAWRVSHFFGSHLFVCLFEFSRAQIVVRYLLCPRYFLVSFRRWAELEPGCGPRD